MEDPPLNPSQHVERIRDILVGRQMHQVEERLHDVEEALSATGSQLRAEDELVKQVERTQSSLSTESESLRQQLKRESETRREQIDALAHQLHDTTNNLQKRERDLERYLSSHLENVSSAMASRIDARVREILQHLQTEIGHWKHQVDRDLESLRTDTVTRTELKGRFARLASAAMEDDPKPDDGFLL